MIRMHNNPSGHVIADFKGRLMLIDTGAANTCYDECEGVRVDELSRLLGHPLDGVLGMDELKGEVLLLTRARGQGYAAAPKQQGAPLVYVHGIPCVDIRINEVACRAAIKTAVTASYISDRLISTDSYTRTVHDVHPRGGSYLARMSVNYFSISDKNFFAEAAELPAAFSALSQTGIDAVLGMDLLNRFDMIMDFAENRLHLVST